MKHYKRLSQVFTVLAILLSIVMCADVSYHYFDLLACYWCSAPASVSFWLFIPYGIGLASLLYFDKERIKLPKP